MHSTSQKAAPAPFPSLQALIGNEDRIHEEQIAPQFHMMHFRKVENSGNFQTSDNHITLFHEHGFVNLLQVHDREVERHVRKYEGRTVRNCFFVKPSLGVSSASSAWSSPSMSTASTSSKPSDCT